MSESEPPKWGFFSRLIIVALATMVVAIAAKPYEGRIKPLLEQAKKVHFEVPNSQSALTPGTGGSEGKSRPDKDQKKGDNITDGDKSGLEAVLNRL